MPIFTIRIFKNFGGVGSRGEWSNTYHVRADGPQSSPLLVSLANELALHESNFHLSGVTFSRAVISPYHTKKQPKGTSNPKVVTLHNVGAIQDQPGADGISKTLPAEVVLIVEHSAEGGRPGRNQYRYAIETGAWTGSGGAVKLTARKREDVGQQMTGIHPRNIDGNFAFVIPGRGLDGAGEKVVTEFTCTGAGNRQVRQYRRKKGTSSAVTPENAPGILSNAISTIKGIATLMNDAGLSPADRLSIGQGVTDLAYGALKVFQRTGTASQGVLDAVESTLLQLSAFVS